MKKILNSYLKRSKEKESEQGKYPQILIFTYITALDVFAVVTMILKFVDFLNIILYLK